MLSNEIFKRDSLGNIRTWQYEVDGNQWRTISGLQDGQKVVSGWTVCTPKSQDTAEAQAVFEANAEMTKKLERTYHKSLDTVDVPIIFEPMLAQTYKGGMPKADYVICQPKLDGIRCVVHSGGMFSRQGVRIRGVPHIEEQLAPVFAHFPDLILDGELYNHDLHEDFNAIASIVRKAKPSEQDIVKARELMQYHVYDVPSIQDSYLRRMKDVSGILRRFDGSLPAVIPVPIEMATSDTEIQVWYEHWISLGYEGQMIRFDVPYEQKRSKFLLKHKTFQDAEFKLTDIMEGLGNWAGYGKRIVCELPDGRSFGAGVKGTQAFTKALLDSREKYIGGLVTVRYFALTPDGIPRFPVAVDFHPDGRKD